VEFVCGGRAERAARQDFLLLRAAAEKLGCAPEELVRAAERTLSERDANFKRTRALLERVAEIEAAEAVLEATPGSDGIRLIHRVFMDVDSEFQGQFATHVAKAERSIALLAALGSGDMLFAQHPAAGKDMNAALKQVLSKLGGKGGGTRDFARGRLEDPAQAEKALALAKDMLLASEGPSSTMERNG
jgi:alanyl-tRNA synthetase